MEKKTILLLFAVSAFITAFMSSGKQSLPKMNLSNQKIDTLFISDSIFQIIEYNKLGNINSIVTYNSSLKMGEYVSTQSIDFHDNGTISEIYMVNGVKKDSTIDGNFNYVEQINNIKISEDGIVDNVIFMKHFNSVMKFDNW